jgi:alkylation response protein AidB-like acyl-CoA dehydrogenase
VTDVVDRALLDRVAERAPALDRGDDDVRPALRELGAAGLLDLGTGPGRAGELPAVVTLVEELASRCLASAFAVWAHRMVIDCYAHAGVGGADVEALVRAGRCGSTALAPALRELAGFDPVPLAARREGERARAVVVVDVDDPGVTVHPFPRLLAMNATASSSLALDEVVVAPERVLSEDLPSFVGACRPRMVLIQTAVCLGLARRAVDEGRSRLRGVAASLSPRATQVADAVADARRLLHGIAARPSGTAPRELAALRQDAARLAGDATRLEAALVGGAGYVADSPTARRLREAAFLPVQAPTEPLLEVLRR